MLESGSVRLHFDQCVLDTERRELRRGQTPVPVQPQVFDLLVYLIENRDRVVSKDDLLKAVWNRRIVSEIDTHQPHQCGTPRNR